LSQKPPTQEILKLFARQGVEDPCWVATVSQTAVSEAFNRQVMDAQDVLWVFGAPGVGKTQTFLRVAMHASVLYFDCHEIEPAKRAGLLDALDPDQAVIFDRIEHWLGDLETESVLFSWWKRHRAGHCLIGQVSPRRQDLFVLPDLASRAHASLVLSIDPLTDPELERLLACHIDQRGLDLAPEVFRFLRPRIPRNPAKIRALVDAMDQESLRDQRRITVPWLKQLLVSLS
jgi:DnaA family protein